MQKVNPTFIPEAFLLHGSRVVHVGYIQPEPVYVPHKDDRRTYGTSLGLTVCGRTLTGVSYFNYSFYDTDGNQYFRPCPYCGYSMEEIKSFKKNYESKL